MKLICVDAGCPDFDRLGIKLGSIVDGERKSGGWFVKHMWFKQSRFKVWTELGLDLTKPVQTRQGQPVRVLATDGPDKDYPVVGVVGGSIREWTLTGNMKLGPEDYALVQSPQKPRAATATVVLYRTRKNKMALITEHGPTMRPERILGKVEVTISEGEGM